MRLKVKRILINTYVSAEQFLQSAKYYLNSKVELIKKARQKAWTEYYYCKGVNPLGLTVEGPLEKCGQCVPA